MPRFICTVSFRRIIDADDVSIAEQAFLDEVHDANRDWVYEPEVRQYLGNEPADMVIDETD